jgi:transcriptional/translational regulatory protein YebC/TACO1
MVETDPPEADELLNCALQAGATEMEQDNQSAMITCQPSDLWNLVTALQERGYNPTEFEHRYVSTQEKISLTPEGYEELDAFLDKMEANEDVTNVYHNVADSDDS